MIFWLITLLFLFLETVYHIACFGPVPINPLITLGLCTFFAGAEASVIGLLRQKGKTIVFWIFVSIHVILYGAQVVYWQVFKQPMLFDAVVNAGGDAVTNYWKEILDAMLQVWLPLVLMILVLVPVGLLYKKGTEIKKKKHLYQQKALSIVGFVAGILFFVGGLLLEYFEVGFTTRAYWDFYDPAVTFEEYGVCAGIQRNIHEVIFGNDTNDSFFELGNKDGIEDSEALLGTETEPDAGAGSEAPEGSNPGTGLDSEGNETENSGETASGSGETEQTPEEEIPKVELPRENILPIDFQKLTESEEREEVKALHQYVESRIPTNKNEYTGMFEGYNLIYLTAEGFAPYCIDEELTPTLYKLTHSGFQFHNFYVPIWQTSTSDGEFVNCTGLIPDQQFSFKRSADITMPFALPGFWKAEGVPSYAYHNNSLSYYDRHRTHDNLGYFFKAALPGKLDAEEWKDHIFEMEHPKAWPQSDLEMMQATIPEYVNQDRFHVYYMTVSGHLKYSFSGNAMSGKNKELVADLPYSNNAKAYVACNIELDRALEWLIAELEKAGKLDNTVICFAADHYPYGLEESEIEELRGAPLEKKYDIYHSSLILWNSAMEPVVIDKPCYTADILPTLFNLFGFEYDSRLYSGQDILSDSTPLVIFNDRSFMTDRGYYDARKKKVENWDGMEMDEEYLKAMKKQVKDIFTFSAGVLNFDYYGTLADYAPARGLPEENTPPPTVAVETSPTDSTEETAQGETTPEDVTPENSSEQSSSNSVTEDLEEEQTP